MPAPEDLLAENALISLEEGRAFLQKEDAEVEQDGILVDLINGASSQIITHTGREFAPKGTASITREFVYSGGRHVDLFPYDVREVTAVVLGAELPESEQLNLADGEWSLRPKPAEYGVYYKLKLPARLPSHLVCRDEFEVAVTGIWGFAVIPELVKQWCKVTVAIWLRKDVSAFSRTMRLDEDRYEVPDGLPSSVVRGLEDFTRTMPVSPR